LPVITSAQIPFAAVASFARRDQAQSSASCSPPDRETERAPPFLHRAPNAEPLLSRAARHSRWPSIHSRRSQQIWPPAPLRSVAARWYWRGARPAGRRSRCSKLPAALVSIPPVSAAKRQPVLAMAKRSNWILLRAFAAHQFAEHKETMKAGEDRSRKIAFSIQTSRTLSEKRLTINRCNVSVGRSGLVRENVGAPALVLNRFGVGIALDDFVYLKTCRAQIFCHFIGAEKIEIE